MLVDKDLRRSMDYPCARSQRGLGVIGPVVNCEPMEVGELYASVME